MQTTRRPPAKLLSDVPTHQPRDQPPNLPSLSLHSLRPRINHRPIKINDPDQSSRLLNKNVSRIDIAVHHSAGVNFGVARTEVEPVLRNSGVVSRLSEPQDRKGEGDDRLGQDVDDGMGLDREGRLDSPVTSDNESSVSKSEWKDCSANYVEEMEFHPKKPSQLTLPDPQVDLHPSTTPCRQSSPAQ